MASDWTRLIRIDGIEIIYVDFDLADRHFIFSGFTDIDQEHKCHMTFATNDADYLMHYIKQYPTTYFTKPEADNVIKFPLKRDE